MMREVESADGGPASCYSFIAVAVAGAAGLGIGSLLGYKIAQRKLQRQQHQQQEQLQPQTTKQQEQPQVNGHGKELNPELALRLHQVHAGSTHDDESPTTARGWGTPEPTPRSMSRADEVLDSHPLLDSRSTRMVVLVRDDLHLSPADLVEQAGRTVLGQFKKMWKRKMPEVKAWEAGGSQIQVFAVGSESDMLLVQSAARSLLVVTHTFAGVRGQKQRSLMTVGPASGDLLSQITTHLKPL